MDESVKKDDESNDSSNAGHAQSGQMRIGSNKQNVYLPSPELTQKKESPAFLSWNLGMNWLAGYAVTIQPSIESNIGSP